MSYYEIRLSRASMECVINALHKQYEYAVVNGNIEDAEKYTDLEAYFQSKIYDIYSVYE